MGLTTNSTAVAEYCAHCGKRLGSVRTLMSPEYRPVHPSCAEGYRDHVRRIEADIAASRLLHNTRGRP